MNRLPTPLQNESRESFFDRCLNIAINSGINKELAIKKLTEIYNNNEKMILRKAEKLKSVETGKIINK